MALVQFKLQNGREVALNMNKSIPIEIFNSNEEITIFYNGEEYNLHEGYTYSKTIGYIASITNEEMKTDGLVKLEY